MPHYRAAYHYLAQRATSAALISIVILLVSNGGIEAVRANELRTPLMPWTGSVDRFNNSFSVQLQLPARNSTVYFAGQEVRALVFTRWLSSAFGTNFSSYLGRQPHNFRHSQLNLGPGSLPFPAFNVTGPSTVRVRVIPAYASRQLSASMVRRCATDQTDIWYETWAMSGRSLMWGKSIALSAYVTFVIPPFPFIVCVKDVSRRPTPKGKYSELDAGVDSGYTDTLDTTGRQLLFLPREPLYLYETGASMLSGDYGHIRFLANGRPSVLTYNVPGSWDPFKFYASHDVITRGDSVKIVPAGFPCTYEKSTATAELRQNVNSYLAIPNAGFEQYSGTNCVRRTTGEFTSRSCVLEGSVANGVARTGAESKGPWSAFTNTARDLQRAGDPLKSGDHLVAFLKLPDAGDYDICLSPVSYRRALVNVTSDFASLYTAVPVWFKAYRRDSNVVAGTTCPTVSVPIPVACRPRVTRLTIANGAAGAHGLTWSAYDTTPGSWGTIAIQSVTSTLNSNPATAWEYGRPRSYFTTAGGDQFRLVPATAFSDDSTSFAPGSLYKRADGTRWTVPISTRNTVSEGRVTTVVNRVQTQSTGVTGRLDNVGAGGFAQYVLSVPDLGTTQGGAGCFFTADNFGNAKTRYHGDPTTKCCNPGLGEYCEAAYCSMSDRDNLGVVSASDLGGSPRVASGWSLNEISVATVHAYVRFPFVGPQRVCYRKAGTTNWQVVPQQGTAGTVLDLALHFRQYNHTYYLNDSSADSVGVFTVRSHKPLEDLPLHTLEPHNVYTTSVADAAVRGASLKIVSSLRSCHTGAAIDARAESSYAGSAECSIRSCGSSATCAGCEGPGARSTTPTRDIRFHLMIPPYLDPLDTPYYRVCFRYRLDNWIEIGRHDGPFLPQSSAAKRFFPKERAVVTYENYDSTAGSLAMLVFRRDTVLDRRHLSSSPGAIGDILRLVPNVSATGVPTMCTPTWGLAASAAIPDSLLTQAFDPSLATANLGIYCYQNSNHSGCRLKAATPTSVTGVVGTYPYTDRNSQDNSAAIPYFDGTVAFVPLPTTASGTGLRICYKMINGNWIEAAPLGTTASLALYVAPRATTYTATPKTGTLWSGSYAYIDVSSSSAVSLINRATDVLKLVPSTSACDMPASGGYGRRNFYTALVPYSGRGGGVAVEGTSDAAAIAPQNPALLYAKVRYYMTLPTSIATGGTVATYKMCFMPRPSLASSTRAWIDLGTIGVTSSGILYDVRNLPLAGSLATVYLAASGPTTFDVSNGGDAAKIVADDQPCHAGGADAPSGITSLSVAKEHAGGSVQVRTAGFTDLGAGDAASTVAAQVQVTLPSITAARYLKLCYKVRSRPWAEVERVASPSVPLPYYTLELVAAAAESFHFGPRVRAKTPSALNPLDNEGRQWPTLVVAGASTLSGSASQLQVTGTNLDRRDTFKFVLLNRPIGSGVTQSFRGADCSVAVPSRATPFFLNVSGLMPQYNRTIVSIATETPLIPGQYLFCYKPYKNNLWIQPDSTAGTGNPFTVVPSRLFATVDTTAKTVTIIDRFVGSTIPSPGLTRLDAVYIISGTGLCGVDLDANSGMIASAAKILLSSPVAVPVVPTATRTTPMISWLSAGWLSARPGPVKVCVRRTLTNFTTVPGITSMLHPGMWYAAANTEPVTGGNYPLVVPVGPSQLTIIGGCPPFDTISNFWRTGEPYRMVVATTLSDGVTVIRTPVNGAQYYSVTATPTNVFTMGNSYGQCLRTDAPTYSTTSLTQPTIEGYATFELFPTSSCPGGVCSFRFEGPTGSGLTASSACSFNVLPTTVASVMVTGPTLCAPLSATCNADITLTALHSDGKVAYTATNIVTMQIPSADAGIVSVSVWSPGTTVTTAVGTTATTVGAIASGEATLQVRVTVSNYGAFTMASRTVPITVTCNGLSQIVSVVVPRPQITAEILVSDVAIATAEEAATSTNGRLVNTDLVPSWDATTVMPGFGHSGSRDVVAGPGYYLVAMQFYTISFRPICYVSDGVSVSACDFFNVVGSTSLTASMNLTAANGLPPDATLVAPSSRCVTDDGCADAYPGTFTFEDGKMSTTFRFQSAKGCGKQAGGCTLSFAFSGGAATKTASLRTPVRGIAIDHKVQCYLAPRFGSPVDLAALPEPTVNSCPVSPMEKGWIAVVSAVDIDGTVDEYYGGEAHVIGQRSPTASTQSAQASLVSLLREHDGITFPVLHANFTAGVAQFDHLVLSAPCDVGCGFVFWSDWGARSLTIAAASRRTNVKVTCDLDNSLAECNNADSCGAIVGPHAYNTADKSANVVAAIFWDTVLCFNLRAANADGDATMFDTIWAYVSLIPAPGSANVRLGPDWDGNVRPYVAMVQGRAKFCFSTDFTGPYVTFDVAFRTQQFSTPGHWATGASGSCRMGTFRARSKKLASSISITKLRTSSANQIPLYVTSPLPTSAASFITTTAPTRTFPITIDFDVVDVYGMPIYDDAHSDHSGLHIVVDQCTVAGLASACASGTVNSLPGQPVVQVRGDSRLLGAITATLTLTPISSILRENKRYRFEISGYCLGCLITFSLRDSLTNANVSLYSLETNTIRRVTATIEAFVVLNRTAASTPFVGFLPAESPLRTFWVEYNAAGATTLANPSGVFLYNLNCFATGATCDTDPGFFLGGSCNKNRLAPKVIEGAVGQPMRLVVALGTASAAPNQYLEVGCGTFTTCGGGTLAMQADIMNSYNVSFSLGSNQMLSCVGTACIDDRTTAPKRAVMSYSSTGDVREAVAKFIANGRVPPIAEFRVVGHLSSTVSPMTDSYIRLPGTVPSANGPVTLSGVTSDSGVTVATWSKTTHVMAFRGTGYARGISFSVFAGGSECPETTTISCLTGATGTCPYTGYERAQVLSDAQYAYATARNYVGIPVPVAIDVVGLDGVRAFGADGTITVSLYTSLGCNNGGTITVGGTNVVNGRLSTTITFTSPCEKCILKAVLTPSVLTVYDDIRGNPDLLVAYSESVRVLPAPTVTATHVIITQGAPTLPATGTVATVFTVPLKTVGSLEGWQRDIITSATASVYVEPLTSNASHVWYGNGGFLRASASSTYNSRHGPKTVFSGTGTVSFMFTRTCTLGCRLWLYWHIGPGLNGTVALLNADGGTTFTIQTAASTKLLMGTAPKSVRRDAHASLTYWTMGSEGASATVPIKYAGVASSPLTAAASVLTAAVVTATNGDGGAFFREAVYRGLAESHIFSFSRPCAMLTVGALEFSANATLPVVPFATRLRATTSFQGEYPGSAVATFNLAAVDDMGYVDTFYGSMTDCSLLRLFECATYAAPSTVSLTMVPVGWDAARLAPLVPFAPGTSVAGTIVGGVGTATVTFPSPVHQSFPVFTSTFMGRTIVGETIGAVTVPGRAVAPSVSVRAPTTIDAYATVTLDIAQTRDVGGARVLDPEATNPFTLEFSKDCPAVINSTYVSPAAETNTTSTSATLLNWLDEGFATVTFRFVNPATALTATCVVGATIVSTAVNPCVNCKTTVDIAVYAVVGASWRYRQPTTLDNGGGSALPGPKYAAIGRRHRVEVQLMGKSQLSGGMVEAGSCDDPTTAAKESCVLGGSSSSPCDVPPSIGNRTDFTIDGRSSIAVVFPSPQRRLSGIPTCLLTFTVSKSGATMTPITGHLPDAVVELCVPQRMVVRQNFTSTYKTGAFLTGVPYDMVLESVDAAGLACRGDSQEDSTEVLMTVVSTSNADLDGLLAVNARILTSESDLDAYTNVNVLPTLLPRMVFGRLLLRVVFCNSSAALDVNGFRIRFDAWNYPSSVSTGYSNPVRTITLPSKLRTRSHLPRYAVVLRPIATDRDQIVTVEAVDDTPFHWQEAGVVAATPNSRKSYGHDTLFTVVVEPRDVSSNLLLGGTANDREGRLTLGEKEYSSMVWTGTTGTVSVTLEPNGYDVRRYGPAVISFQATVAMALDVSTYTSASYCKTGTDCLLPLASFLTSDGKRYSNVKSLQPLNLYVVMLDDQDRPVRGESEAVVEMYLTSNAGGTVLANQKTPTELETGVFRRFQEGVAFFDVLFITENGTDTQIKFRCPETRPKSQLSSAESNASNPCAAMAGLSTLPLSLVNARPSSTVFTSMARKAPVIRGRSSAATLRDVSWNQFAIDIASRLAASGFRYINKKNVESVVEALACVVGVKAFSETNDLGDTVCKPRSFAAPSCTSTNETDVNCPYGVQVCFCPNNPATAAQLSRQYFLSQGRFNALQATTTIATTTTTKAGAATTTNKTTLNSTTTAPVTLTNATETQLEVSFRLDRAKGFLGTTNDAILKAHQELANATLDILSNDPLFQSYYKIRPLSLTVRSSSDNLTLATAVPVASVIPPNRTARPGSAWGHSMAILTALVLTAVLA